MQPLVLTVDTKSSALSRNPGIDVLRGAAIVLVVLHHIGLRISQKDSILGEVFPQSFLNAFIYSGYEAVMTFFVVSGFLITSNTIARGGDLANVNAPDFYLRRAARILPCFFALILVLCVLHWIGWKDYAITSESQSLSGAVLSAIGLHLNWYEGKTGYLPANWDVLWSLSIEEVFYLAFPVVCVTLRREWMLYVAVALLALSLPYSHAALNGNDIWQEKAYLPGFAAIAMGVFGALVAKRFVLSRGALLPLALISAATVLAVVFVQTPIWKVLGSGTILLLTISTMCLVLTFHWQARNGRPWSFRGTGWLQSNGRLSYEIYLTHMFIILPLVQIFHATGADARWGFLSYIPAVVGSYWLGWIVQRLLSEPCEQYVRTRFARRKSMRASAR